MNRKIILVVAVLWFVSILLFLVYAATQKVVAFDQHGKLWQWSQQPEFDQVFTAKVTAELGEVDGKVIHFTQTHCDCNSVADQHINSVKKLASKQGYENRAVVLDKTSLLSSVIPATPAIAAFDKQGKLFYLGPYSAGYACTVGNGIIESFLVKEVKSLIGATVVSDTQGCYCSI